MRPYTLALAANTPVPLHSGGEYFLLETAPLGGVKVEFFGASGVRRDQIIEDGEASTYAHVREGFTSLKLTSALAQTVKFYIARDGMGRNVFSGSSDVTDRAARLLGTLTAWVGKNRLYSPGFVLGVEIGAVAAQAGFARLFNPAASGVRVFIDAIHFSSTALTPVTLRTGAVAGALYGVAALPKDGVGAAPAAAELHTGTSAAIGGVVRDVFDVPASSDRAIRFEEPVILAQNQSLWVCSGILNNVVRTGFEWREGV
jgi:hypothetical protein